MTDFPTTPANGDTHVIATSTWEYYASTDRWEIKDTSGSAYYVDTVIDTLTWSAGTTSVTSVPIVYSDYITVTVTYTAVSGDTAVTEFQMSKSAGNYIVVNFPHGTGVISGTPMWGLLPINGTTSITTATGTASNDVTINTVFNTSSHTNVIGADHSTLTFGWSAGAFAAGGSIVITGRALIIDPNSIGALSDVNSTVATDGQVLTWDNTNSYWKPAGGAGGGFGHYCTWLEWTAFSNNSWYENTYGVTISVWAHTYQGISADIGSSTTTSVNFNFSDYDSDYNSPTHIFIPNGQFFRIAHTQGLTTASVKILLPTSSTLPTIYTP